MRGEFSCRRCGRCCRWPGCVRLETGEAEAIAGFLGMAAEDFYDRFTAISRDRSCLILTEEAGGRCVFLEDGEISSCRIDPVKPRQCRAFPLEWNFPGWEKECPGAGALPDPQPEQT